MRQILKLGALVGSSVLFFGCPDDPGTPPTGMLPDGGDDDGGSADGGAPADGGPVADLGTPDLGADDAGPTDRCADVDCSDLDDACNVGTCDPADGTCSAVPVADGSACDDGMVCNEGEVCTAGVCGGGAAVDCSAMTDMCNVGMCDPATGACMAVPVADGSACDDGMACTTGEVCTAGACGGGAAVDCSAMTDMCNVGMCDPATGACTVVPAMDGTSCDDADMCTTGDVCTAGVCGGSMTMPPAGDTCANPLMLSGADGATTTTGTLDGCQSSAGAGSCAGGGADVIYTMSLTAPRRVSFATVDPGAAGYDTALHLRTDCADPMTELACNDDSGPSLYSSLDESLMPGTYFLYADAFSAFAGDYELQTNVRRPDGCADAPAIELPAVGDSLSFADDSSGATNTFTSTCGNSANESDHVYEFTVTTRSTLRFELTAASFDTVLHVREATATGCEEGAGTTLHCNDDASGIGLRSRIVADYDPGTYYVIVDGFGSGPGGTFTLEVENVTPPAISFPAGTETPFAGSPVGGSRFDDDCPAGQALIGVDVLVSGYLRRLEAVCGEVFVSGTPGAYSVGVRAGATLPARGRTLGSPESARCPADQVVAGFGGRAGSLVDQLRLRCAPLSLTGDTASGFSVVRGAITDGPAVGGTGGAPFPDIDCPPGRVAAAANIRAGDGIDGFGVDCSAPTAM